MNSEIKKKWFVYVGDHHEGPFYVQEVQDKKKAALITDESFVWCEGMPDWVMLTQAPELIQELEKLSKSDQVRNPKGEMKAPEQKIKTSVSKISRIQKIIKVVSISAASGVILFFLGLSILSRVASEGMHSKIRPLLTQIADKTPVASGLFKLIPNITDIKPDDMRELERARIGAPENGVNITIALSQFDANRPYFYVSTNLPNQTKFTIYLVGNSETLVNRLQFASQMNVTTTQGFGKSEVFFADAGQLIPKGEYQVYVTEAAEQIEAVKLIFEKLTSTRNQDKLPSPIQASNFLIIKTVFIGGERDQTYLTRLKSFHEKVKQNSEREVLELKQYTDTLDFQFIALTREFEKIRVARKITPVLLANWKKNAGTWQQINTQLDQTIQTWSKETLQNEFFYGKVYGLVKNAYDSIKSLSTIENAFVSGTSDHNAFDIQYGKAHSEARESIELLKSKMDAVSKAPKSPSGLPTREGL